MRWEKQRYEMITSWGEYELQCEMDAIYIALKVEQIKNYTYSWTQVKNKFKKKWHKWNEGEWFVKWWWDEKMADAVTNRRTGERLFHDGEWEGETNRETERAELF